jgi:FkbM family methyltransferase
MTYRLLGIRYAVAKVNDYLMRVDFKTPGLSKVLFIYGTRELPDTYVAQNIITPGMVVADIGANIGYYTLLAAQRVEDSGHVYAFEPDPRNINLLRDNLTLNGLTHRVTIYEQAVSNTSEKKIFQLGERSNVSSFVDRPDVVGAVEVDCIALHQFPHIDKIDMLRMDAEGYECKIIAGALPYFRTTKRPFTIMLEVHPEAYDDQEFNFAALLNELFALGFSVSHSIAGSNFKAAYEARGYRSRGHWVETKHPCELFTDIKNVDAQYFLEHAMIRAMVIKRDAQKNRGE